jgi:UDP-N-acetylmuramate dehydrogenase
MSMLSPARLAELAPTRRDEPLSNWTTMRIGGPADYFVEPQKPEHLASALDELHASNTPYRLLGGGANVLAPDGGVRGAVVHTGSMRRCFRDEPGLRVWPGVTLPALVRTASELGLAGLELLIGVPGQLGGALAMNAGSADWGIWDQVEEVVLWRPSLPEGDRMRAFKPEEIGPGYRDGSLGDGVVLEVLLRLEERTPKEVKAIAEAHLKRKNLSQPVKLSSAGCAFKNPQGDSAGRLIDAAGLKGVRVGGAQVSEMHANFLVNRGGATAEDVRSLLRQIEETVEQQHGIRLQRELVVWDEPSL